MRKFLAMMTVTAVPAAIIAGGVWVKTLPLQDLAQVLGG